MFKEKKVKSLLNVNVAFISSNFEKLSVFAFLINFFPHNLREFTLLAMLTLLHLHTQDTVTNWELLFYDTGMAELLLPIAQKDSNRKKSRKTQIPVIDYSLMNSEYNNHCIFY